MSDVRYRMLVVRHPMSDEHLPDFGKNLSDLRRKTIRLSICSSQSQEDVHPISDVGRPKSGVGWTSARLREELIGSWKKNDPTSDLDVGPDRIWIHLLSGKLPQAERFKPRPESRCLSQEVLTIPQKLYDWSFYTDLMHVTPKFRAEKQTNRVFFFTGDVINIPG
jgi:hypothetical protein